MGAGGQAWVSKTCNSPLFNVYYSTHDVWDRSKTFEIKALGWLKNGILKLVFVDTIFHKSSILLIFEAELTESVFSRIQSLTPWLGPKKIFQNEGAQIAGKRYLEISYKSAILPIFEAEFTESVI